MTVKHDARNRTRQRDRQSINKEEDRSRTDQTKFLRIRSKETQDARIADAHDERHDGNGRDLRLQEVADAELLKLRLLLFRKLHLRHLEGDDGSEADDEHGDAEINDVIERHRMLHEHAEKRADGGGETHAQGIVVDALAAARHRNDARYDRARRRRSNAVTDTVQTAHDVEHGKGIDEKVQERRGKIEDDTRVEHELPSIKLDGMTGDHACEQCAEDEDAGRKPRLAHRRIECLDRFGCDDDHEHVIDDIDQEVHQGIKDELLRP